MLRSDLKGINAACCKRDDDDDENNKTCCKKVCAWPDSIPEAALGCFCCLPLTWWKCCTRDGRESDADYNECRVPWHLDRAFYRDVKEAPGIKMITYKLHPLDPQNNKPWIKQKLDKADKKTDKQAANQNKQADKQAANQPEQAAFG
eukprot:g38651.t1